MAFKLADAWVDVEYRTGDADATLAKAFRDKKQTVAVDADTKQATASVSTFERRLQALANQKIKVDADIASAEKNIETLAKSYESKIAAINARGLKIDADIRQAELKLERLRQQKIIGPLTEDQTIQFDADIASAEARVAELKAKVAGIEDARIKVDADTAAAQAKLDTAKAKAAELDAKRVQIQVDADTAAAQSELAATEGAVSALDGRRANVNVDADVGAALAKIALVSSAIAALGIGAVAGLGAIGAIGATVGAGVGALAAGLGGVGGAVKDLGKANAAAGGAAGGAASNHLALASAMDRVKSSQAALANTQANAAAQIRRADDAIVDAKRNLERAYEDAAYSAENAARRTADAEQRLSDAQYDSRIAQEDLTRAREDAARQLQDLSARVEDLALSERGAALSVLEAQQRLQEVNADGRSTDLQKQRAQLAYEEALNRVEDLRIESQRAAEDKAKADAAGIEGADGVVSATERVRASQEAVRDAEQGVADARQAAGRDAERSQDQIAAAIERVKDAELAAADARRQAEFSIAQAKQSVVDAQRAVQQASQSAGGGGGGGGAKNPLAGLSPTAAAFAVFLRGFIDGPVAELRRVGQENLLPGLQRGLEGLVPIMHSLIPAFGDFSRTLGNAFATAIPALGRFAVPLLRLGSDTLQSLSPLGPIFDGFVQKFDAMTVRVGSNGTLQAGMAGLSQVIGALLTVLPDIIEVGLRIMAVIGQPLADAFVAIIDAVLALAEALGPLLGDALEGLVPLFEGLTAFMTENPALVRGMTVAVLALIAGFRAFGPISTVISALTGPLGLVVLGVAALAAGVAYAYTHSATFRRELGDLWTALQRAGGVIMDTVGPALSSLWGAIKNDLAPAFTGLLEAVTPVVTWLVDMLGPAVGDFLTSAVEKGELAVKALAKVFDALGWVIDKIPGIDGVKESMDNAGMSASDYGDDVTEMTRKSDEAKRSSDSLAAALDKVTSATLGGRQAERDYYAAVDAATQAVKTNGRTLNDHTAAGRANNAALDTLAKSTNAHTAAMVTNGASQKTLDATLATSRASFIKTAIEMGATEAKAKSLAAQVLKIPKAAPTTVGLTGYMTTMRELNTLLTTIATVNGKSVAIQVSAGSANVREGRITARARGGPVTQGMPYIVGETQPELFVPEQSGTIIPDLGLLRRSVTAGVADVPAQRQGGVTIANLTMNLPPSMAITSLSHSEQMKWAQETRRLLVTLEGAER